jgi:osmotically-inducible protein OsmY
MYSRALFIALALSSTVLLQGCVAMVAGGAATGVAVAHDHRSAGAIVDDQGIEIKAYSTLKSDREIYKQAHVSVTSYNGIVLVTGEAPTEALRKRIGELVSKVDKVRRVHNEVALAAPSSMVARSNDTYLTSKVKTRMIGTKGFDSTRVKVVTEGGVVYLMGLVTRKEADIATDIARQTDGVQRVVKIFEYVD